MELKTNWYDENLKVIKPKNKEIGAILLVTKEFKVLNDYLINFDLKRLKSKVNYSKGLAIDVFNGWSDLEIKVYALKDFEKEHDDYLKVLEMYKN